jgi:hypothetical protein
VVREVCGVRSSTGCKDQPTTGCAGKGDRENREGERYAS